MKIIVPSIRPQQIEAFKEAWGFDVQVVWDNDVTYKEIEKSLGKDAWIISRKNAAIRCWGYLQTDDDILTLDDDCWPVKEHIENMKEESGFNRTLYFPNQHLNNFKKTWYSTAWTPTGIGQMRGLPYENLERQDPIYLSHGLWTENCDFDAMTEITGNTRFEPFEQVIPRGQYYPMCSMNLAFRKEIKTLMYMPPMGEGWPYDRWDDIWCGVLSKKVMDHLGLGVWSGSPFVRHTKKSDKWKNLRKEVSGYEINEIFWQRVDEVVLTKDSVKEAYIELSEKLNLTGEYFEKMKEAMRIWAKLC